MAFDTGDELFVPQERLRKESGQAKLPSSAGPVAQLSAGDHNFRTNGFVEQLKSRMPDSAMSAMGRD